MIHLHLLLSILLSFLSLHAMDLPTFDMKEKETLAIVEFYADTTMQDEQLMYVINWKTTQAKKVTITFIGEIDTSGSLLITEKEYHYGPITLTATDENNVSVSKTIGDEKAGATFTQTPSKKAHYRPTTPYRRYPYRRPRRYY